MSGLARSDARPWYRQPWLWFVVALPASSVIFSVATLVIAVRHADSLVRDDWYDAGVSINRDFDRERAARALGLEAMLSMDEAGRISVVLGGSGVAGIRALRLELSQPIDASRDRSFELVVVAPGRFASLLPLDDGRWDVALTPPDASWRMAGRVDLARGQARKLDAEL